jgi:hypothetical protein
MFGKTDETLRTVACNIRVQPLQHMQHPDLLLQHPYERLATYLRTSKTLRNIRLQHTFFTLLSYDVA